METELTTTPPHQLAGDLLILAIPGATLHTADVQGLDAALGGRLLREAETAGFRNDEGARFLYQTHGELPSRNLLLLGCPPSPSPGALYDLAARAHTTGEAVGAQRISIALGGWASADAIGTVAEGMALARYRFEPYRSQRRSTQAATVVFSTEAGTPEIKRSLARAAVTAAATCYARDLINTPASELTPAALAAEARRLRTSGLRVNVHDRRGIKRLKMNALLGVARGSTEEPRFIELVYRPPRRKKRSIALVGKGITFDSGGLALKRPESMRIQKRDMAGSAVVLAVMRALPALKPAVEVRGYVPAAENMPGGGALKPGDVVRACNGKSIEVLNTDAEGRLVLADALSYAARKQPDIMLDVATLTAAVQAALGTRYAAIMGTAPELIDACIAAGKEVNENLWELPLAPEYRTDINSAIADLKNTGEGRAGTIIGGLFLREFVGEIPWAHVDFSSTAFSSGHPCHPKGATGFAVRTVLRLLRQL